MSRGSISDGGGGGGDGRNKENFGGEESVGDDDVDGNASRSATLATSSSTDLNEMIPLEFGDEVERDPSWFVISISHKTTANAVKHLWLEGTSRAQEKVVDKLRGLVDGMVNMDGFQDSIAAVSRYNAIVCKILRKNLPHQSNSPGFEVVFIGQTSAQVTKEKDVWWISPKFPVHIPVLCTAMPGDILMLYGAVKVENRNAIVLDWTQTLQDVIVIHCSLMGMPQDVCTKSKAILGAFCKAKDVITHEYVINHGSSCEVSLFYPYNRDPVTEDEVVGSANVTPSPQVLVESNSCMNPPLENSTDRNRTEPGSSSNTKADQGIVALLPSKNKQVDVNDSWGSFPDLNQSALNEDSSSTTLSSPIDYEDLYANGQFLSGPERPKVVKFKDKAEYVYRTLREIDVALQKSIKRDREKGRLTTMCLMSQQFLFGYVVAICPANRREFNAYHVRISDETMSNVLLRIHGNPKFQTQGPEIAIGNVIRVHRVTAQVEYDYGDGQGEGSHKLVLSTTPHHNYTLFSVDEGSKSIIYNTCAQTLTISGHDKRRAVSLLKHFCDKDQRNEEPERRHLPVLDVNEHVDVEENDGHVEEGSGDATGNPESYSAPSGDFHNVFENEVRQKLPPADNQVEDVECESRNLLDTDSSEIIQQRLNSQKPESSKADHDLIQLPPSQNLSFLEEDASTNEEGSHNAGGPQSVTNTNGKNTVSSQSQKIDTQSVNLDELLDELCDSESQKAGQRSAVMSLNALESQILSFADESQEVQDKDSNVIDGQDSNLVDGQDSNVVDGQDSNEVDGQDSNEVEVQDSNEVEVQESNEVEVQDSDSIATSDAEARTDFNPDSPKIESESVDLDKLLDELGESDEELERDLKPFNSPRRLSPFRRESDPSESYQPPRKSPRFHRSPPPDPV